MGHSWRHFSEGCFDAHRYAVELVDEGSAKGFVPEAPLLLLVRVCKQSQSYFAAILALPNRRH
ncbi:hypothetical protein ACIHFD_64960 [Nonomuraea sp. NPDC051941]|uniref:hypothetical protein n=1 Tax=Nonomuraea sp. NPDC051941 TaxID=3364373 RepID=UPI0037C8D6B0